MKTTLFNVIVTVMHGNYCCHGELNFYTGEKMLAVVIHINTCFPFLADGNIFEELEGVVKYFRIDLKTKHFFMVFYRITHASICLNNHVR